MNISKKEYEERKSYIKALFFMEKIKQKVIAEKLWITIRTVKRYVKKSK